MTNPPPPTKPPAGSSAQSGSGSSSISIAQARSTLEVITSLTQKLQEQLDSIEASQDSDVV